MLSQLSKTLSLDGPRLTSAIHALVTNLHHGMVPPQPTLELILSVLIVLMSDKLEIAQHILPAPVVSHMLSQSWLTHLQQPLKISP